MLLPPNEGETIMHPCKNSLHAAREEKRWLLQKKGSRPPLRVAYEPLEGGAVQLLAFHERKG
jgi:hypothetical protein